MASPEDDSEYDSEDDVENKVQKYHFSYAQLQAVDKRLSAVRYNQLNWSTVGFHNFRLMIRDFGVQGSFIHAFQDLYSRMIQMHPLPIQDATLIGKLLRECIYNVPPKSKWFQTKARKLSRLFRDMKKIDRRISRKRRPSPGDAKAQDIQEAHQKEIDIFKQRHDATNKMVKKMSRIHDPDDTSKAIHPRIHDPDDTSKAIHPSSGTFVVIEEWIQKGPDRIVLYMPPTAPYPRIATMKSELYTPKKMMECVLIKGSMLHVTDTIAANRVYQLLNTSPKLTTQGFLPTTQKISIHYTGKTVHLIDIENAKLAQHTGKQRFASTAYDLFDPDHTWGAYPETVSNLLYRYSRNWDVFLNNYLAHGDAYFDSPLFKEEAELFLEKIQYEHNVQLTIQDIIRDTKKLDIDLDTAFKQYSEVAEHDMMVYRGVKDEQSIRDNLTDNTLISSRLVSTTMSKTQGINFTRGVGILMKIRVPKGTPFFLMNHSSYFAHEQEVLFPKGTKIVFESTDGKIWKGILHVPAKYNHIKNPCRSYQVVNLKPYNDQSIRGGQKEHKRFQTHQLINKINQTRRLMGGHLGPDVDKFILWIN